MASPESIALRRAFAMQRLDAAAGELTKVLEVDPLAEVTTPIRMTREPELIEANRIENFADFAERVLAAVKVQQPSLKKVGK